MYKTTKPIKTSLNVNTSYEGETIEKKINRIINNKEPIKDGAPIIYTDRRDGVKPEYDIRTDRFELATEAMDYINKSHITKRQEFHDNKTNKENEHKTIPDEINNLKNQLKTLGEQARENMNKESNTGGESIQATNQ